MSTGDALTGGDAIRDKITAGLQSNDRTAKAGIGVAVLGSTATLTGTVGSQEDKMTAESIARSVPGVIDVTNELVIDDSSGGLFGFGGDRSTDTGGTDDNVIVPVAPLAAGSGVTSGSGMGYGAPAAAAGILGVNQERDAEPSGETTASREADAEEEDMSQ